MPALCGARTECAVDEPRGLSPLLAVAVVAAGLAACTSGRKPHAGAAAAEPGGGRWIPIVLRASDALRVAPPPAAGSPRARQELEELLLLQNGRTPQTEAVARFWSAGAVVRWNEIARDLVARRRTSLPMASRVYALLSVAQHDALIAAWRHKYAHGRHAPDQVAGGPTPLVPSPIEPSYPCAHATVGGASATVLSYLYPDDALALEERAREQRESGPRSGVAFPSDIAAGDSLGRAVAKLVVDRARGDGSDAVWTGTLAAAEGGGGWTPSTTAAPLLPLWGRVKPWLMSSVDEFLPAPPPLPGSPEFHAELAEVKKSGLASTREQVRIAALWADGSGSYTPAGRWNKIAADRILDHGLNELRAARVFALLNTAVMDAGIACWETKYRYLLIRPSQADGQIATPVGLPNFPAYTSAHAALSGAAAEVLGHLFPAERAALWSKADEAAVSRLHGGIHYRFDAREGLAQGRAVAQLAIARARVDGAP